MTLTALLPTRARPAECERQLRFLRDNHFAHRVVVLDVSAPADAELVRRACSGIAEYRHFGPEYRMADKLAAAVIDVTTPYVVLIPDDDVVLPQAIADAMTFLDSHPDFVVAHGYFIDFRVHDADVDFHHVAGFTPSIVDEDPLRRHYELFRRYQSFYWGVFRTDVFRTGVRAACAMEVVTFRELTVMSTAILQGKVARLRSVYALRGTVRSHAAVHQSHPFFFFLRDPSRFFGNYVLFRNAIAAFIRRSGIATPTKVPLEQFLDLSYATYLGREMHPSTINHAVKLLLGDPMPPIPTAPPQPPDWQEPGDGNIVHRSISGNRRYIWRRLVLEAEPRNEIAIAEHDMARVERQLDSYR
jgi:glycosyltransferase domain-containing protein